MNRKPESATKTPSLRITRYRGDISQWKSLTAQDHATLDDLLHAVFERLLKKKRKVTATRGSFVEDVGALRGALRAALRACLTEPATARALRERFPDVTVRLEHAQEAMWPAAPAGALDAGDRPWTR